MSQRVNETDLEEDEFGIAYWYGKPFTGTSYQLYENGQIFGEAELIDGVISGYYRQWYPSGSLEIEGYARREERDSWQREWFEDGTLKYERKSEFGRCVKEKKWNEQSEQIYEYKRPSSEGNSV